MKKLTTLFLLAMIVASANAIDFTYNWSQLIEGRNNQGAVASALMKTKKSGKYLVSGKWGTTKSDGLVCDWNKESIIDHENAVIEGFAYDNGTSYNSNLLISMIDPTNGTPKWHIYTNIGDQSGSCTNIVELSDGSFVTFITEKVSNNTTSRHLATIIDAKGNDFFIEHNTGDSKATRVIMLKFNGEGEVLLTRTINAYELNANGANTATALYVKAIAADTNDNIYLAGYSSTEFYVIGKSAKVNSVSPTKQVATLVKFDKDGYYLNSKLCVDGEDYKTSQFDLMKIDDDKIYLFGKYAEAATGGFSSVPFFTTCNLDLELAAIHSYTVAKNAKNSQNWLGYDMYQHGNNFYISANIAGTIAEGDVTVGFPEHTKTTQAATIIKIDNTGKLLAGQTIKTENSGMRGCVVYKDKVLAIGYVMTGGTKLYEFDGNLSALSSTVNLVNGGMVADALAPIVDGDNIIVATRSHKTNYAIYGVEEADLVKPNTAYNYSETIASWSMSGATGISSINKDATYGDGKTYNLLGVEVKNADSHGIYIQNGGKVLK